MNNWNNHMQSGLLSQLSWWLPVNCVDIAFNHQLIPQTCNQWFLFSPADNCSVGHYGLCRRMLTWLLSINFLCIRMLIDGEKWVILLIWWLVVMKWYIYIWNPPLSPYVSVQNVWKLIYSCLFRFSYFNCYIDLKMRFTVDAPFFVHRWSRIPAKFLIDARTQ